MIYFSDDEIKLLWILAHEGQKLSDFLHGNPIDLNDRKLLRFLSVLKED